MDSDNNEIYFPFRDSFLKVLQIIEDLVLSNRIPSITITDRMAVCGYRNYRWDCGEYQITMRRFSLDTRASISIKRNMPEYSYKVFRSNNLISFDEWYYYEEVGYYTSNLNPYSWYNFFNDLYKTLKAKKLIDDVTFQK